MRILFVAILVLHGIAHMPGVIGSWNLAPLDGVPYHTTLLGGRVDVGDAGMRVMGAFWLLAAVGFVVAGAATALHREWAPAMVAATAAVSLGLCILEYPAARIGLALDLAILAVLAAGVSGLTATARAVP